MGFIETRRVDLKYCTRENLEFLESICNDLMGALDEALSLVGEVRETTSTYPGYALTVKFERFIGSVNGVRKIVRLIEKSTNSGIEEYPNRVIDDFGYARIYNKDYTDSKPEHRYVVSKKLKRNLLSSEHIHHKDGNKSNNDIENLELMDRSEHMRYHAKRRVNQKAFRELNAKNF
jgi:hypothetical protein